MKKIARPMLARDKNDHHRAATELELLFDLVFVIAIALAAVGLHHAVVEGHYVDGVVKFLLAFFALWWPWMHFTWFASAFDNDDTTYRVSVMVMMFGALLIAGSIPVFFESLDTRLMTTGYVVLRLPYIFLWTRAGKANPDYRATAQRYVWGQTILQFFWLTLTFLTNFGSKMFIAMLVIGIVAELFVPFYANKTKQLPFHKHHIMERFGLLNIIVLGEVLLSAALAIEAMSNSGHWTVNLIVISICATIVPFTLWWLYFNEDDNLSSEEQNHVFLWGYGHFIIFAAAAAVGSGFAALVDASGEHAHGNPDSARWLVSIAVSLYVFGVWFIRDRHIMRRNSAAILLVFAILIALTPLIPKIQLPLLTLLLIVTLILRLNARVES